MHCVFECVRVFFIFILWVMSLGVRPKLVCQGEVMLDALAQKSYSDSVFADQ